MANISLEIERLLLFCEKHGLIEPCDKMYVRNQLLGFLRVDLPYTDKAECSNTMSAILDYCCETGLIPDNSITERDLADARIMGMLMPRPSEVIEKFRAKHKISPNIATDWFYSLSQNANYIQTDRIAKNIKWLSQTEFGELEMTINLSKPEKNPAEIAKLRNVPASGYPKCLLCAENEGFFGNSNHPARQNLRLIPFTLDGEQWYFQYSPYVYYNEHCIVLNEKHTPMFVSERTFRRLLDFLDEMPHYFLGSNAGLPVVGGSILAHDHYQGGRHVFPMEKAQIYNSYQTGFEGVTAGTVKWPMPCIRLNAPKTPQGRKNIIAAATKILTTWEDYSDSAVGIFAHTDGVPHNAITPITRIKDNNYQLDIVLRNNITTEELPLGVFHPHPELWHIKKENIGLIEVMGLAVLPGRLETETAKIAKILTGESPFTLDSDTEKHADWIKSLIDRFGTNLTPTAAEQIIKDDIGRIFTQVLSDAGVFKYTEEGRAHFQKFMEKCDFKTLALYD